MFRIVQISDCHLYADIDHCGYGDINPYESLRAVLALAKEQEPDLLVFTGDLSNDDSPDSYQHFKQLLVQSGITCEIRIIPGNHDNREVMETILPDTWLRSNQQEQKGDWRLFYLDSQYVGTQGRLSEATLDWLAIQIEKSEQPNLVFIHHHPIATASFMDKHKFVNGRAFLSVLEQANNKTVVCHGHIHHASEKMANNIRVWSAPSSCWQWSMTDEFGTSDDNAGFRVIDIEGATITTHIIRI